MSKGYETKQRLLDSAQQLMYSRSYSDVGVQEICKDAKVQKGSFYHFFTSKSALTVEVLEQLKMQMIESILLPAFAKDLTPAKRFERFIEYAYQYQVQLKAEYGYVLGCPMGNIALEMSTQDEEIRKKVEILFESIFYVFVDVLDDARLAGEIDADADTTELAQAALAYGEGVLLLAKTKNDPEVVKRLLPHVARLIGLKQN
ncbi:MAG: TetR/AcrR family transcriptional regulator [Gammaproteobacteria bacterium]|nr:TetR/AcrR family transcriptional regulator [Gammaproteobacteria bacterium]